jgi:dTDP-4-dehydrorhamnose reductase
MEWIMSTCDDLIVGGDGLIGRGLTTRLRQLGHNVVVTSRREGANGCLRLDLAEELDVSALPNCCGTAYLLAAVTSMAACEADPSSTAHINVEQISRLAGELLKRGVHVIVVSTNLVLDGLSPRADAEQPRRPQNVYAAQKAELERRLLDPGRGASVLRCTKVAETLSPLLSGWSVALRRGETIHPFSDLVCSPLPLAYVVDALVRLGQIRTHGLYQISADRDVNYGEIARSLAERIGNGAHLRVHPSTSVEMNVKLPALPRFTSLNSIWTERQLGLRPAVADEVVRDVTRQIVDVT